MGDESRGDEIQCLIKALSPSLRRRIICHLVRRARPLSPVQTSKDFDEPLSNVAYHYRTLLGFEVLALSSTRPEGGSTEYFYELAPGILAHPMIQIVLLEGGAVS